MRWCRPAASRRAGVGEKVVYRSTFKLINLGQSPDERYEDELVAKVRSLLRGTYKIGVLGKGGVGKSTIAAGVGSIFAELRQDDRVVAIDADTAFGKLAARIDPQASGSYWELASDPTSTPSPTSVRASGVTTPACSCWGAHLRRRAGASLIPRSIGPPRIGSTATSLCPSSTAARRWTRR